jgi:hypothetical protein
MEGDPASLPSLPGLTRQSITQEDVFAKRMDARVI